MSRKSSRYFEAGGLTWKLPRQSHCAVLNLLLFSDSFFRGSVEAGLSAEDGDAEGAITSAMQSDANAAPKLLAAENATGAAIGLCWHSAPPLRTPRPVKVDDLDALLHYGDAVMDEIDERGHLDDPAWFADVSSDVWTRGMKTRMPTEHQIAAMVGNGLSPEVTAT